MNCFYYILDSKIKLEKYIGHLYGILNIKSHAKEGVHTNGLYTSYHERIDLDRKLLR